MKQKRTIQSFEQEHGGSKIKRLERDIEIERQKVSALSGSREKIHLAKKSDSNIIRFGVISDTHFGSLYSCPEGLAAFYDGAKERGVEVVLHSGDVLDGWKIYKGQEFELQDVGMEAQVARFKEYAPKGISTKFITGNHDTSFTKLTGVDVGRAIQQANSSWECIGEDFGKIVFTSKDGYEYSVALWHMDGGTSYALSYRIQQGISSLEGGTKPNMVVFGHFHKSEFIPAYRNVAAVQAGTFCWQTPFMRRKNSQAHVGGWYMEVQPGARYNAVKAEFVAFYR